MDNDQARRIAGAEPPLGGCDRSLPERARRNLREHFAVVGLTERFDEALLLLRRELGRGDKLYYVPRLVNRAKPPPREVPAVVLDWICRRNELDLELYRFAAELLADRVARAGDGFAEELAQFRERNRRHVEENRPMVEQLGLGGPKGSG